MDYRLEHDSMGEIEVPSDRYWGAQTQRSFQNFKIGIEKIPMEVIRAFAILKKSAAVANNRLGKLDEQRLKSISQVCDEILSGKLDDHFPLSVWQTGSGTQSNMNVNEVIANRGNEIAGEKLLHPNDHVNMSQSSNDTFPTAMHIAAVMEVQEKLLPSIDQLIRTFLRLEKENEGIIKSGRTHLQDATPIQFSQEISGWRSMLEKNREMVVSSLTGLKELALGGTAVGTGLNAPKGFDTAAAAAVSELTGIDFRTAGSSIMPGKVNPTQCESVTMVAVQVMGNDCAIGFAASQGNFELNVFMPVIIYNFLQSVRLLSDSLRSFELHCARGIKANRRKMNENLNRSLMLVTALAPYIGYDHAAQTAKKAYKEDISLKEACISLGFLTGEEFDRVFHPEQMVSSQ